MFCDGFAGCFKSYCLCFVCFLCASGSVWGSVVVACVVDWVGLWWLWGWGGVPNRICVLI